MQLKRDVALPAYAQESSSRDSGVEGAGGRAGSMLMDSRRIACGKHKIYKYIIE